MHSEFFGKTVIGIPYEQWQRMLVNRFYVVQLINLETNKREVHILSNSALKTYFPRHWKELTTKLGEKSTWFPVKRRKNYVITTTVLESCG
ncbi:hypothetical protein [Nostoc sp. UHCC 0870]|uniref:hypothetical protein n=1 Tax=Nostoc sp. UHCC 0870 TaxID=2914041 RepID=UPI001EDCA046|nr:hypothetical protein [Nostoc sp. UHCC 0870]UKP00999.1 hypothetical protein L6494_28005 [Nostoc sp. UHCC 0870]